MSPHPLQQTAVVMVPAAEVVVAAHRWKGAGLGLLRGRFDRRALVDPTWGAREHASRAPISVDRAK